MPEKYHYLLINVLTIAYPLAQSYERRIRFLAQWKAIVSAIVVSGAVFLVWDEIFTRLGVWGFNDRYLIGLRLGSLPIEEYGFFLTVPFSCLFIYEVLNHFIKKDFLKPNSRAIAVALLMVALALAAIYRDRTYTFVAMMFASLMLVGHLFWIRSPFLGRFFVAYFIALVPFLIMNGWLTGSFTDEPIVWYNNSENMGFRLGTVPFEDSFYLLGYLLLVVGIYERIKTKPTY
jgi:lycopene cyclase domain-containing protein